MPPSLFIELNFTFIKQGMNLTVTNQQQFLTDQTSCELV